ncbi:hypothetical protein CI109_106018 [Kwoniella shandongensis]|uniref:Uncharacterized protein n=1 Tax=Kwoniella shandongensis TaxID=1734106 RepID=A0A5M6BXX3_9TREE|nr:uncharacterized protein CI109_003933 [Kwoniella shandongensis]KAA5527674.1 hypothetical protein CI109_003933 [Kwoniella shandongensis]
MAPRATYTPELRSLIESTVYPPVPHISQLEQLRQSLIEQSNALATRYDADSLKSKKEEKRKRKEREEEEKERLALEANERAGMRLELLERNRVAQQQKDLGAKGRQGTGSPSGVRVKKERTSLSPAPSNASSTSFRPGHAHGTPITYGGQVKKKKIKRVIDSDDEASQARDRSTTLASPPPHSHHHPHQSSTSGLKLKLSHTHPSHPQSKHARPPTDPSPTPSASAASNNIDFSLPPNPMRALVPPRPGVQKPMKPGPKKQSEVDEDYSNTKAPNQVAFPTFWSGVEPYLRDVREDDLAMLGFKADAPESYEIPPRGRHYTEIWDEEDGNPPGSTSRFPVPNLRQQQQGQNTGPLAIPHFVPAVELRDENLVDEHRGLGSLTERVVAAVVGKFGFGEKKDDADKKGEPPEDGNREPAKVDVVDLEERMRKELRAVMLLGEHDEFDPSSREDDEVTSALRQCQRLLSAQTALNDARKARLAEIARQRLAYTEYQSALEGIEKSVEASWAKRIKKYGTTPKKSASAAAAANGSGRPPVPEQVKRLVAVRKHWIETVGQCMKERPRGEVVGLPNRTVFEGIGEDEEKDEKSVEEVVDVDEMDVDEGSVIS